MRGAYYHATGAFGRAIGDAVEATSSSPSSSLSQSARAQIDRRAWPTRIEHPRPQSQSAEVVSKRQLDERESMLRPRINDSNLPREKEIEQESHCMKACSVVGTAASWRPILAAYLENMHHRVPFCSYVDILRTNEGEAEVQVMAHPARMQLIQLYMACAIGACVKQLIGAVSPAAQAHEFLERALALQAMLQGKEEVGLVDQAEITLWLVLYKLRTSYTNEVWSLIGSAMRAAIAADLHRERHYHDRMPPPEAERHCLLFWAVYTIERNVCWAMRRPFSLADYDIDVRLPTPLSHPACLQGNESNK